MRSTLLSLILAVAVGCGGSSAGQTTTSDVGSGSEGGSRDVPQVGHDAPPSATAEPETGEASESAGETYGLMNGRRVSDTLVTGGQPDDAVLQRAADAGVTTVITLRQPSEPGFDEERAKVEELGMHFVSIPVAGAEGLTEQNAQAVDEALDDAEGQTVLHCGSGNRAGALLALRAFYVGGKSIDEALEIGRGAGLTRLEDAVRQHLEGYCAEHADAAQC